MKKNKVLLSAVGEPEEVEICFLASYLREKGYMVKISTPIIKEDDDTVDKDYIDDIVNYRPDFLGLCINEPTKKYGYKLLDVFHDRLPNTTLFIGGAAVLNYSCEILSELEYIDYAIEREAEITTFELLECLNCDGDPSGVKGLTYRNHDGEIIMNEQATLIPDLDILPFPSRDLIVQHKLKQAYLSTSRGCYMNCSFCIIPEYWKGGETRGWRGRSIKKVVDEMEEINRDLGIINFSIADGSFEIPTLDRGVKLAEEILRRDLKIFFMLDLRADMYKKATDNYLGLLKKAGLVGVFAGIEAGNDDDLKLYNKGVTVDDSRKLLDDLEKNDINYHMGFINFNPYSTYDKLYENMEFMNQYNLLGGFGHLSKLHLSKGAGLYEATKKDGLLEDAKYDEAIGYRFADERIGNLYEFLENYFLEKRKMFGNIFEPLSRYKCFLTVFFNYYDGDEHIPAKLLVQEFVNYIDAFILDLNKKNYSCYSKLLNMSQTTNDRNLFAGIIDDELNHQYLTEMMSKMQNKRYSLIRSLIKLNPEYLSKVLL